MLLHRTRLCVFIVLASFCQVSKSEKPIISPNDGEIVIDEGKPLYITCTGYTPIKFGYPNGSSIIYGTNLHEEMQGVYTYRFNKENSVIGDTGWYYCAYYRVEVTTNSYDPEVNWIYVYVKSNKYFFVNVNTNTNLSAIAGDNIIIPCRTTSPNLKPELFNGNEKVNKTQFNPRVGFTIRNLQLKDTNSYTCLITKDDKNYTDTYTLTVHQKQKLSQLYFQNDTSLAALGRNLNLNCTIEMEMGMQYEFDWNTPQQNSSRKHIKAFKKEIDGNTLLVTSQLMIFNLTDGDSGDYECIIKSSDDIKKISKKINVYRPRSEHIEFFPENNNTHYRTESGNNVEMNVIVEGYMPYLQWFKSNDERIVESPKYFIKFDDSDKNRVRATLKIIELNILDSGNYTLQAQNVYLTTKKNFSLDVIAKPVSLLTRIESYYPPNESTEFHCEVISNPPSNVTWRFLQYPNYPSFENTTIVYLTNVTQAAAYNSRYKIESMVKMYIEMSGKIICEACNELGCDSKNETILVSDGVGAFGIIGPRESVVKGDNIELVCAASVYNYTNNFTWTIPVNETETPVNETERLELMQDETLFTYRSILKLNNVEKSDAQDYFCTGEIINTLNQTSALPNHANYTLIIHDPILPFFTETNMNKTKTRNIDVIAEGYNTVILKCFADGMPKPTVSWYKDNIVLNGTENDKYLFKYLNQELHIQYLMPPDSGNYSCRATSRLGTNETYQQIMVKNTQWDTLDITLVTSIPILGFILMIVAIFFVIKIRREKKMKEELMETEIKLFEEGAIDCLNLNLTPDDQANLLPYDKKWEFPRERLKLKESVGSGYFGMVKKAEALGICKIGSVTTVAVKMVRQNNNLAQYRALVSELKIMVHLGKHLNIVNLLGACTKNISKRELLVITEYCCFGNLRNYLFWRRNSFINQIDSKTGKLDFTIDGLRKIVNVDSINRSNSCQLKRRSSFRNCKDQCLKPICTQDLLSWAFQVSRGMEYLSQRKVLHGDLAARNILLTEDNIVKISDFGLAKNIYNGYYKKKGQTPVPIKWMAIESIGDRLFSTQSDVWSFGIMLWEFFTLAKMPYPGIDAEKLYQKLVDGYRMEQPDYAIPEIYDIMLQCWEAEPTARPNFTNLVESIGDLLEESLRAHYISLNKPYMDINEKNWKSKVDFLKMMSAPNHTVISHSGYESEDSHLLKDISSTSSHFQVNSGCSTDESDIFNSNPKQDHSHIELPSDSEDTIELSPILKHEEDLKLINVHERRPKFIRQRQMKNQLVDKLEQNSVHSK